MGAAVEGHDDAVAVRAGARGQPGDDAGDVLGHAQAAIGRPSRKEVPTASQAQGAVGHPGNEDSGGNGVDQHAARAQLDGQTLGQVVERGLAGAVAEVVCSPVTPTLMPAMEPTAVMRAGPDVEPSRRPPAARAGREPG